MLDFLNNHLVRFRDHRLYADIFQSTSGRLISAALTFLRTILLVRLLAPDVYGEIAVIFSWGYVITAIFEIGAGSAFIALESSAPLEEQNGRFWQLLRVRAGLCFLVFAIVGFAIARQPSLGLLKAGAALVLGLGQTICHSPEFLFQTQKRFRAFSLFIVLVSALQLFWTGLAVWIYRQQLCNEVTLWFLLSLSVWFAAAPILVMYSKSQGSWAFHIRSDLRYFGRILAFGKWVALTGILAYLYQRWAVILLGSYGRPTDAAAYDVALNFSQVVNLVTLSAVNVLSPRFASSNDYATIKRGFLKVFQFGGPVVTLILAGYYVVGAKVVTLLFGNSYTMSLMPLNALIPSFLFTLLTEPIVTFATFGLRRPDMVFGIALIKTVAFLLLGAWIMKEYGLFGLALVQSFARILEHIILALITILQMKSIGAVTA